MPITQAVLLSAGFGTRIRTLFPNIPKVMAPLLGKPLLEWHIQELKKYGVREFFINLHYKPEAIRNYFSDGVKWDVKINYALEEPEILGTAGGVKNFDGLLAGSFFVLYADTFYRVDYARLQEFYAALSDPIGVCSARRTDHPWDSDLAVISEDNQVTDFLTKPHRALPPEYWGTSAPYIFSDKILPHIPPGKYYEIDHDLVPELLKKGHHYYAYKLGPNEFRKDVGTPERYREVEEYLSKNH